jgi:hypothetical protein
VTTPRRAVIRPTIYWWIALLLSSLTTGVVAIVVARNGNAESQRKWCRVVVTKDDAYRETPPATAAGKNFAESISQLRRDIGCPQP